MPHYEGLFSFTLGIFYKQKKDSLESCNSGRGYKPLRSLWPIASVLSPLYNANMCFVFLVPCGHCQVFCLFFNRRPIAHVLSPRYWVASWQFLSPWWPLISFVCLLCTGWPLARVLCVLGTQCQWQFFSLGAWLPLVSFWHKPVPVYFI